MNILLKQDVSVHQEHLVKFEDDDGIPNEEDTSGGPEEASYTQDGDEDTIVVHATVPIEPKPSTSTGSKIFGISQGRVDKKTAKACQLRKQLKDARKKMEKEISKCIKDFNETVSRIEKELSDI